MATAMSDDDAIVAAIWGALATVIDPELGLDVVTLGLVYEVAVQEDCARVVFTLTTPGCPMERIISDGIENALAQVVGISRVDAQLVWDPAWHPGMIAPDAISR